MYGGLVEFEIAFRIDGETHGHRRHLGVEHSAGVHSKRPGVSSAVVGDGERPPIGRERDAVGFGDPFVGCGDFAGLGLIRVTCWAQFP